MPARMQRAEPSLDDGESGSSTRRGNLQTTLDRYVALVEHMQFGLYL